ncbi:MAG: glutathione S-transferase C-terminal domain-containing protein [Opitutaceae bacterium]|nr:glutathione S-transferase C-terminal domain-containing protein [Opitutaceae bacterium]
MTARSQYPEEQTKDGEFQRQQDEFRDWVRADGSTLYRPEPNRYQLYVSFACPWAHRTLIVRHIRGLGATIGVTVLDPVRDERGWAFRDGPGHSRDLINGFAFLRDAYEATNPRFRGRWTVPVLWDRHARRIVNNSEDDICRMFNDEFPPGRTDAPQLFPPELAPVQEALSARIYECINNGVYRAGFATQQRTYERAVRTLFEALDDLEARLATRRYLFAAQPVETDWRLFCTLVRFDAVYFGHFKCNLRRIVDYPNLQGYLQDLYQVPGIAGTVNFDHIKRHYYVTHTEINPTRIVPLGPDLGLSRPHGRESLA